MLSKRTIATASLGFGVAGALLCCSGTARANGFETPGNGTEQMGRGSAWLARASDPLAVFYNPAALSRNGTGVSVTANLWFQKTCFEREPPSGSGAVAVTGGQDFSQPKNCNDVKMFPNPQAAFQYRVNDKLGIGIAVLGPSAANGKPNFPANTLGQPYGVNAAKFGIGPQQSPSGTRYLLTSLDATIIWPQIAAGYEVAKNFRVGASLIWGMAFLKFGNYSMGTNAAQESLQMGGGINGTTLLNGAASQDLAAQVSAHDYFVPGFVLSAMYSPTDNIDVAAWFHWSDKVKASGSADLSGFQYDTKGNPADPSTITTQHIDGAQVTVPQPWEAKLGVRYFMPREGVHVTENGGTSIVKDPLADEVFDVEVDGEYDHDSQFDVFGLQLPAVPLTFGGITASAPANADVPHMWKDSFGVRLGGDWNILPSRLAVRAGGWYQSSSMQAQYIHVDFVPLQREGLNLGASLRVGPVDIQAGYGHVFYKSLDNNGDGLIYGLTGTAATSPTNPVANRTQYPVNGGTVSSSADVVSIGVVYRFGKDDAETLAPPAAAAPATNAAPTTTDTPAPAPSGTTGPAQ